jgi:hypothetical protein
MAQENVDYSYAALLADARAKRDAWEAVIDSLEKALAMGSGAPGAVSGSQAGFSGGAAVELPLGALMGKSVSNAIKIYLSACKKKQTAREIETALKEGGVESTSKNFDIIVSNTLRSLKKAGTVLQFKDGWGLAELYPESIRSRIAQQENSPKKKASSKKKKAARKTAKAKAKNDTVPPPPKEPKVQEMPKAS